MSYNVFMKLSHLIIIIPVVAIPFFSFAQTVDKSIIDDFVKESFPTEGELFSNSIGNLLDVSTSPSNPGPNEIVQITIESYLSDLDKATISWSVNGRAASYGIGKTSFSFKNGGSGETTKVTISIITNTGERVTKELVFNPVGVTVLWEANTYTPPFYKGKPLMSPQAWVRAIAIPDIIDDQNSSSAQNLVYVWKKNGTAIPEASGYGKSSYSFFGPKPGRELGLRVAVSSIDDSIQSELRVDIPLTTPFILFYEKHPLLGALNNHPLGGKITLTKKEVTVTAEPYFFSNESSGSPWISYVWSLNGTSITNPGRTVTLRNEQASVGASELALVMRNTKLLFQSASRSLTINFVADESARPNF